MVTGAAPSVFVSYAHGVAEHRADVEAFATFLLAGIGLDVRLDTWSEAARNNWPGWMIREIEGCDFVLVIASPQYRRAAEDETPVHVGRGVRTEVGVMLDLLMQDRETHRRRILPVLLPGAQLSDIPRFLSPYSDSRYRVPEFTADGVADLLAAITGRPRRPRPQPGPWRPDAHQQQQAYAAARPGAGPRPAAELPWLAHSPDVRRGRAVLDGACYDNSVILRPDGVAAAPTGFVEWDLGGDYRSLCAVVGVLDDAAQPFQVGGFRVLVDGEPRVEVTGAYGLARPVRLDLSRARRLRLELYRPAAPSVGSGTRWPAELAWGTPTLG
jgi:hypothetical protein